MKPNPTLEQILDYLFPRPEQANDVKAWAERRLRKRRRRTKASAA